MKNYLKKILNFFLDPKIFFLAVAILLVQLWFTKNILFGGTEAGVPTYTPGKILDQIRWLWWEALGPGISIPSTPAAIPLYLMMAILEKVGFRAIDIQKFLFLLIIYFQGLGASLIFKTVVSKDSKLSIMAGLLYIFNPFMMIFVWHRFIYANFILSAALPFFMYFYLQLIEKGKIKFILLFLFTSFLSSYMFSSIAPVIAIWIAILVLLITAIILNRRDLRKISNVTILSLVLFVFWILTNLWWILPLINTKTILSAFSLRGTVDTLITLSTQSTISNVIRGINPYVIYLQKDWGEIYSSFLFQILSWILLIFVLVGLIKRPANKRIWYMILLFLGGIFLAKGAAEPLGKFTAWLYGNIFFLGAIRNSFEKLGLLVILPSSILATLGLGNLWNLYRNILKGKLLVRILVLILIIGYGVYIYPMRSDKLFGSRKYPPFFTLPTDYPEISDFLSKELENDSGKILHLPITEGDAATYNWQYEYNGVELASHLFPGSSISRFLYSSSIDQLLGETARIFHGRDYPLQRYLLSNFSVKYIVLNKNLDWSSRNVDNPKFLEEILNTSPDLKVIKQTNNLKVYKFVGVAYPVVSSAGNLTLISGTSGNGAVVDFTLNKLAKENGVSLQVRQHQQISPLWLSQEVIFPTRIFDSTSELDNSLKAIIPQPYIKHLPNVFYYPLILLKEKIEFLLTPPFEKNTKIVLLSQKRLKEAILLREQHQEVEFKKALIRYTDYLNQAISEIKKIQGELGIFDKIILRLAFREEKEILDNLLSQISDQETATLIEENLQKITDFHKEVGFEVYYFYDDQNPSTPNNKNTYQFPISNEIEAEIMLNIPNLQLYNIDNDKKIIIFLDGVAKEVEIKNADNHNSYSLGKINLKPGIHEISLTVDEGTTPVQTSGFSKKGGIVEQSDESENLIRLTSDKENAWVEYPVSDYDPNKTYLLDFYYRVLRGSTPLIHFWQDSDELRDSGEPKITKYLGEDLYDFDWKHIILSISTNNNVSVRLGRNATQPRIRLYLPYWNNCEAINIRKRYLCENLGFREVYNKPSMVEIRDLKIRESFSGTVFLNSAFNNNFVSPSVNFSKISPVEYLVKTESDSPFLYIILNEGFHSGWKLIMDSDNTALDENRHFLTNGYANGWLIEKGGKMSFKIKFVPQDYLNKGILLSFGTFILVIFLIIVQSIIARKANRE